MLSKIRIINNLVWSLLIPGDITKPLAAEKTTQAEPEHFARPTVAGSRSNRLPKRNERNAWSARFVGVLPLIIRFLYGGWYALLKGVHETHPITSLPEL